MPACRPSAGCALFLFDLGSRTGLWWGGERRLSGWVDAEGVDVGPYRIRVPDVLPGRTEADELEPTARAYSLPGAAELTLDLSLAGVGKPAWRVSLALVLFGRSNTCRVQVDGEGVSSVDAGAGEDAGGAWVVDLLTTRGTTVNGDPVRAVRLEDGDEIGIGTLTGSRSDSDVRDCRRARLEAPTPARTAEPASMPASWSATRRMQEMMADQFQQTPMTMFRMFGGMHQDQMKLIREELAQLRELSDEQRSLQERLARVERHADQAPEPVRLRSTRPDSSDGEIPAPVHSALKAREPAFRLPDMPPPGEAAAGVDLHLQIAQRLASIRDERQGRWQKLIGSMMGKDSPGSSRDPGAAPALPIREGRRACGSGAGRGCIRCGGCLAPSLRGPPALAGSGRVDGGGRGAVEVGLLRGRQGCPVGGDREVLLLFAGLAELAVMLLGGGLLAGVLYFLLTLTLGTGV